MVELFQASVSTGNGHIRNLYEEGELQFVPTIRKFRIVQTEGSQQVSGEQFIDKANAEYEKYLSLHINAPSPVERHFLEAVKEVKRLEKESKSRATRKTRNEKEK